MPAAGMATSTGTPLEPRAGSSSARRRTGRALRAGRCRGTGRCWRTGRWCAGLRASAPWARATGRPLLRYQLIDAGALILLELRGPVGGKAAASNGLIDARGGVGFERGGHLIRIDVMCPGDVGQRLSRELLAELIGADTDGACSGVKRAAEAKAMAAMWLAKAKAGAIAELATRLLNGLLELIGGNAELARQRAQELLHAVARLRLRGRPRSTGRRRRGSGGLLRVRDAERASAEHRRRTERGQAALHGVLGHGHELLASISL